ncbi:MAG: EcoRV family type II restriction endonuclease [Synergistaceae bacterium]|nr:EcoRV family type II restriction endonuclease [Synergistaceae bacterium]
MYEEEKNLFFCELTDFTGTLAEKITSKSQWNIRGFIDIFKNVYTLSPDTKVISKVLEIHLLPELLIFAERLGYKIEPAEKQNWYPDFTFIKKQNNEIKFAVDLKTTYRDEEYPSFCNGFTLGSHGEYFKDRKSTKNIQYPYSQYSGHFCLGIIYSRNALSNYDKRVYSVSEISKIPAVIKNFIFFAAEKWKIASDKSGSGNTANIGSIQYIDDILKGNGVFAKAGEELFDDYWINFGRINVQNNDGTYKVLSSFTEYLHYRGLSESLNNPRKSKRLQ